MHRPGRSIGVVAFVVACAAPQAGMAHFQGLQIVEHATVTTAAGVRTVYRVYAMFSAGSDQLLSWGSSQGSLTSVYTGPCTGTAFYQAALGGNTAPTQKVIDEAPNTQWDTFATIGVSIADQGTPFDQTLLSPGFPTFISGNQVTLANNLMVFVPETAAQSRADFAGDGDAQLRVLMMQLTVAPDQYPYGTVGALTYRSGGQNFTVLGNSWIGLAEHGRCCVPDGTCVLTYHSSCAQFVNGFFLQNCEPCSTCAGTCVADIEPHPGDGDVDVDDLLAVINGWGPCSPFSVCPPDVAPAPSGNNQVDVDDLLAVINAWGPCP